MSAATNQITLLIADHHKLMVEALSRVIGVDRGFVIETAGTLAEIKAAVARRPFDIMLLDYNMPELTGIDSIKELVALCAPTRIALFSDEIEREAVLRALQVGVRGYIPKTSSINSLTATLRLIAVGEIYVPLNYMTHQTSTAVPSAAVELKLSQNDLNMLRALEMGKTNKEIGRQFGLTEARVKMLLRSIYTRLNAKNRTHVVTIAKVSGLI